MGQIASRGQLRSSLLRWMLVLVPLVLLLGIVSGRVAGSGGDNAWFKTLEKPAFMPPDSAFPIAWTILFVLLGLALAIVANARGSRLRGVAIALFVVQFAMVLAWAPLFFAMHEVTIAFWWIVVLIVLAAVTAWYFYRVRPVAGLLFVPFLGWLVFAAALNLAVHRLNPDAERVAPEGPSTQISI